MFNILFVFSMVTFTVLVILYKIYYAVMALLRIFPLNPDIKGALVYSQMKIPETSVYV